MSLFEDSGMKMFAFTTKHHEGFSMFDTKARVRKRVNYIAPGKAIYATRARGVDSWYEGDAIRYTRTKDNRTVYAIATRWPGKELLLTRVRPRTGASIHLLGSPEMLKWNYDSARGLSILLPDKLQDAALRPCDYSWCFEIPTGDA